jgi:glycosyltransferase involved in cell wall biosynthesis
MVSTWPEEDESQSGGVAGYTYALTEIMSSGAEITVLSDTRRAMEALTCSVQPAWRPDVITATGVRRAIEQLNPDVVHIQHELLLYGSYLSALAFPFWVRSIAAARPTVVTVHGVVRASQMNGELLRGRMSPLIVPFAPLVIRNIFRGVACLPALKFVHQAALAERLIEYGAKADDVAVVPMMAISSYSRGASPRSDRRSARRRLGIEDGAKVVLSWGFLNTYKGFDALLEGFARFQASYPTALLLLGVGQHPKLRMDRAHLREHAHLAEAANATRGVRFVGFIPEAEVADYIEAADVAVFAYTQYVAASGLPLDAASLGTPVLLSAVFEDAPKALTFAPNPDAIAKKLADFFENPAPFRDETVRFAAQAGEASVRESHMHLYTEASRRFKLR